jgi:hypothetical protein
MRKHDAEAEIARQQAEARGDPRVTVWRKLSGAFGADIFSTTDSATHEFNQGDVFAQRITELRDTNTTAGGLYVAGMTITLTSAEADELIALAKAMADLSVVEVH